MDALISCMIAAGPPPKRPPHMLLLSGESVIRRVPNPKIAILALLLAGSVAGCDREKHRERSEEHTSELQSLMRISYAVFCLKKKKQNPEHNSLLLSTYAVLSRYKSH